MLFSLSVWIWGLLQFATVDQFPPRLVGPPVIVSNPNPKVPLAAILTFETNEPAVAILEINGVGGIFAERRLQQRHEISVLGLAPGALNTIRVSLSDAAGNVVFTAAQFQILTAPLPDDFPPINASVSNPFLMEAGVTLFNVQSNRRPPQGLLIAVNSEGKVVWYYRTDRPIGPVVRTRAGTLLYLDDEDAVEIDMLGNTLGRWHPGGLGTPPLDSRDVVVATNIFHHEISELPNGNFLTLSSEVRSVEGYPSSETNPSASPAPANVVGDVILEFTRSGAIVREWKLFDVLDPYRIRYDSLSGQFDSSYRSTYGPTRDWSHGNSVSYDAVDDSFVVSLRHQDAVVKISRSTGRLLWIFGAPDGWRAPWNTNLFQQVGVLRWPFHQHAARITPQGTLLMFDNGNYQAKPFEPKRPAAQSYSRAVEYRIDESSMTASEIWGFGGPGQEPFYSPALGNAEWMPNTGNVLFTDGAKSTDAAGNPTEGGRRWARIVEVTRTTPAEKVFELAIGDPSRPSTDVWTVYRGTRLDGLYPVQ